MTVPADRPVLGGARAGIPAARSACVMARDLLPDVRYLRLAGLRLASLRLAGPRLADLAGRLRLVVAALAVLAEEELLERGLAAQQLGHVRARQRRQQRRDRAADAAADHPAVHRDRAHP